MKGFGITMNKVIYRDLVKEDYGIIKELIGEAFGFNEFIKNKKFLDLVLDSYMKDCLLDSSFSKVAEKDNKLIGFILGKAENDENILEEPNKTSNDENENLDLIMNNEENQMIMQELLKIKDTYNEIIKGKENNFQGAIQLFIVSKESRGLGVGKTLINHLFNYMKSRDVKSLYLYTDTRCNYGFYDSQNFKRINEKEITFTSLNSKLNVFLYSYDF